MGKVHRNVSGWDVFWLLNSLRYSKWRCNARFFKWSCNICAAYIIGIKTGEFIARTVTICVFHLQSTKNVRAYVSSYLVYKDIVCNVIYVVNAYKSIRLSVSLGAYMCRAAQPIKAPRKRYMCWQIYMIALDFIGTTQQPWLSESSKKKNVLKQKRQFNLT